MLKKELLQYLRSKRTIRRSKQATQKGGAHGQITDMISISERPASVEDRAVPGHWEGDLISGSKNSYIATLVERQTRYVMLAKVANKDTRTVVSALIRQAKKLPTELYKSLTWDRGKELAAHRRFTLATDIDVYFCDPQSPWQRGSNENTNGLLRQYFPKGTDVSVYSQAHLNKVARQLNERPQKTLEFETLAERFNACVASTGWGGSPKDAMRPEDAVSCSFAGFNDDQKERHDDTDFCNSLQRTVYPCGPGAEQEALAFGDPGSGAGQTEPASDQGRRWRRADGEARCGTGARG